MESAHQKLGSSISGTSPGSPGSNAGCAVTGRKTSGWRPAVKPVNEGGFTPTMVTGTWLMRIVWPRIERSRPKRRAQNASLMTATVPSAFRRSSAGRMARPARGRTPID